MTRTWTIEELAKRGWLRVPGEPWHRIQRQLKAEVAVLPAICGRIFGFPVGPDNQIEISADPVAEERCSACQAVLDDRIRQL